MQLVLHEVMRLHQLSTGREISGKSMRVVHVASHVRTVPVKALQHAPSQKDLC